MKGNGNLQFHPNLLQEEIQNEYAPLWRRVRGLSPNGQLSHSSRHSKPKKSCEV
jgi:hypothetical protein